MYLGHVLWKPTHTHVRFVTWKTAEGGEKALTPPEGTGRTVNKDGRAAGSG